jgi:hypothetical protein
MIIKSNHKFGGLIGQLCFYLPVMVVKARRNETVATESLGIIKN